MRGEKSLDGKQCPYYENEPQTLEGYQAWDVVLKTSSQITETFPLDTALKLAENLGCDMAVMSELLPAAATGVLLGIKKLTDNGNGDA